MTERIPADGWEQHLGHVARYRWAAQFIGPSSGYVVNDVACGVGYGSTLMPHGINYYGYDEAGVPDPSFPGVFLVADLDDPSWTPVRHADVTLCFETLEHLRDPARVAATLAGWTHRAICVSVPTVPTVGSNPYHLHDFTPEQIPPMFPGFMVAEVWEQPEELSHVWRLERAGSGA